MTDEEEYEQLIRDCTIHHDKKYDKVYTDFRNVESTAAYMSDKTGKPKKYFLDFLRKWEQEGKWAGGINGWFVDVPNTEEEGHV